MVGGTAGGFVLVLGVGIAGVVACGPSSATPDDRVCDPGAYVFCRCKDESEGTKVCKSDGHSFGVCTCAPLQRSPAPGGEDVPSAPDDPAANQVFVLSALDASADADASRRSEPPVLQTSGPECNALKTCCTTLHFRGAAYQSQATACEATVRKADESGCADARTTYATDRPGYDPPCD